MSQCDYVQQLLQRLGRREGRQLSCNVLPSQSRCCNARQVNKSARISCSNPVEDFDITCRVCEPRKFRRVLPSWQLTSSTIQLHLK